MLSFIAFELDLAIDCRDAVSEAHVERSYSEAQDDYEGLGKHEHSGGGGLFLIDVWWYGCSTKICSSAYYLEIGIRNTI